MLAVGRLDAGTGTPSLSPACLLTCDPVPRLVLPSPNGSTIATRLQHRGATVVAGWLTPRYDGRTVAVVAAGEQWSYDNSLRPALRTSCGRGPSWRACCRRGTASG